jgi:CBS domain-containing protein
MLSVRDVMTRDPITIAPQATLRDAVDMLTMHGVSGLPVVARGVPVGTLSARDIVSFTSITPGVPTERDEDDLWDEAVVAGTDSRDDDDDDVPGAYFADLWEGAGADVAERFRVSDSPEWDILNEHTVDEAMSRDVISVESSTPLDAAAESMQRVGAHRALVVDDCTLVGIVTTMDVTRAVADHRLS